MQNDFAGIFDAIRPIFAKYENDCFLIEDAPGKYYLGTHELRAKDGYRTWFGGVEIKKNYVSVHLVPVYMHPTLLEGIPDKLRKRMQGKACFNFKAKEPELIGDLEELVGMSFQQFKTDGRI